MRRASPGLRTRIRRLRAMVFDIDGVFTDGTAYWTRRGESMKRFSMLDGRALDELREKGLTIALITGERSRINRRYAKILKVKDFFIGSRDKLKDLKSFSRRHRFGLQAVAYAGDDTSDLTCLQAAGVAFSVPNAPASIRRVADRVTERKGGEGAVREIADFILKERDSGSKATGERGNQSNGFAASHRRAPHGASPSGSGSGRSPARIGRRASRPPNPRDTKR